MNEQQADAEPERTPSAAIPEVDDDVDAGMISDLMGDSDDDQKGQAGDMTDSGINLDVVLLKVKECAAAAREAAG